MISECIIHHWLIDIRSGSLIHEVTGEQRRLGEYQLKLLIVLVQHVGVILTRKELNTLVWESRVIGNNSLPNAIHALRVALEDDGKQQRIIKTIPRKGYILEAEFCEFRREEDFCQDELDVVSMEEAAAVENTPAQNEDDPVARSEGAQLVVQRHMGKWFKIALVQCSVLILLVMVLSINSQPAPLNSLTEQDTGTYSNIQLYELHRSPQRLAPQENLTPLLTQTLFALNQMLKNQQVRMRIFFFTSDTTMNYTLLLISRCDRRQLAMNIAQWRTDNNLFNALIYRETERKLNEMATCIS
ncbi:hypothetical protein NG99_15235 [Erwinia typographi]|uniref:OmpR/PhoB-type domain-containing protein n=1 Tax=Erwinia typographi TaxID=371042 RepID=A0A0A3Z2R2_9GAMM|nr:transcriptional regulator [Erwinia typographi]KGT91916.1 hypothetical protein NG99_15235 [Erwinia typographi]